MDLSNTAMCSLPFFLCINTRIQVKGVYCNCNLLIKKVKRNFIIKMSNNASFHLRVDLSNCVGMKMFTAMKCLHANFVLWLIVDWLIIYVLWKDFIMYTYFSYLHICWNGTNKINSFVLTLYTCTLFCILDTEQFCILDTEHLADTARYIWLIQNIR
jgi:hypothetical protein